MSDKNTAPTSAGKILAEYITATLAAKTNEQLAADLDAIAQSFWHSSNMGILAEAARRLRSK